MSRRPDIDRSRAVLIGVGEYGADEEPTASSETLSSLNSVSANLTDVQHLLTEPDLGTFAVEHCQLVENPKGHDEIGRVLEAAGRDAEDVLLVYYSGHGLVDNRGRLYLGLPGTNPSQLGWTALPFELVREALQDSPAAVRILVLDCCFSGRAFESMSGGDGLQSALLDTEGTYTLASSAANQPSFAPRGEPNTAFTGALLAAARQSPGQTLEELYRSTRSRLAAQGRPEPHRRSVDAAGDVILFGRPDSTAAIGQPDRTFEFDEARRVVPSAARSPLGPGFWNVSVRNGSATPITQLHVQVYPVSNSGIRTEDECVTAKGHPALAKVFNDRPRAVLNKRPGSRYPGDPFHQMSSASMLESTMLGNYVSDVKRHVDASMPSSFPASLSAGADSTVVYFAPDASSVRADLTFTDSVGNKWTRSDIRPPHLA
jgi:hypothetical protein